MRLAGRLRYNDDETEIDMEVDGDDLITKSMMLVSDDVDDDHQVDNIADDAKNDRTHKIQLGGKFQVKSVKIDGAEHQVNSKTPVRVVKTIKVKFFVCKYGPPLFKWDILSSGQIAYLEKRTKERFSQCGIKIEWAVADGTKVGFLPSLSSPPTWGGPGTALYFSASCKSFFLDPLMPVAPDEIPVYAVGQIGATYGSPKGLTTVPLIMTQNDIADGLGNRVLIGRYDTGFVVAHELLHVLLNAHHADGGAYQTEFGDPQMIWHPTVEQGAIMDTKRISIRQANAIMTTTPFPQ